MTAMGTIDFLHLQTDDVVLVMVRNYRNIFIDTKYKQTDMSWAYSINRRKDFFALGKSIRKLDKQLQDLVEGNQFEMYGSSAGGTFVYQVIFSHPQCVGMNYLQEGAYVDKGLFEDYTLSFPQKIFDCILKIFYKHRVWASARTWRMPYFLENKRRVPVTYASTKEFFSVTKYENYVVKWPSFDIPEKYKINSNYPCFVFEASVEWNTIEKSVYMKYSSQLIKDKAETYNYVKFHPYQNKENIKEILSFFECINAKAIELPMDFPFEIYLSSYKGMKVYGFNSSLLVFARQLGHTTYSLEEKLLKSSKKYRDICIQLGRSV